MTKYVFTYYGGSGLPEDPAEVEKEMAAWSRWFETLGDAVVDGGNPFGQAIRIAPDGSTAEADSDLGGFSVVSASDIQAAVAMAKDCPVLANGGSVQVSEALEM